MWSTSDIWKYISLFESTFSNSFYNGVVSQNNTDRKKHIHTHTKIVKIQLAVGRYMHNCPNANLQIHNQWFTSLTIHENPSLRKVKVWIASIIHHVLMVVIMYMCTLRAVGFSLFIVNTFLSVNIFAKGVYFILLHHIVTLSTTSLKNQICSTLRLFTVQSIYIWFDCQPRIATEYSYLHFLQWIKNTYPHSQ